MLLICAAVLSLWLYARRDVIALRWIRRARYLLIVPPLISGYAIAGTAVLPWDVWAPTWEGLQAGVLQSLKLLVALLALRAALQGMKPSEMTRGLISLLAPLRRLGFNAEKVARRLQLTLHYLEEMDGQSARQLLGGIRPAR